MDTKEKVFIKDDILKARIATLRPVGKWLQEVREKFQLDLKDFHSDNL